MACSKSPDRVVQTPGQFCLASHQRSTVGSAPRLTYAAQRNKEVDIFTVASTASTVDRPHILTFVNFVTPAAIPCCVKESSPYSQDPIKVGSGKALHLH